MDIFINESKGQTQGHCEGCMNLTNHDLLFSEREISMDYTIKKKPKEKTLFYNTIKCRGCDRISFALLSRTDVVTNNKGEIKFFYESFPDPYHPSNFDDDEFDYFPGTFLEDSDIKKLPKIVRIPYEALYEVYHLGGARILSGIALRLILESVSIEQKIPGKNLKDKIDNLLSAGDISKNALPTLHSIREIGNVSAHEIKEPKDAVLDLALEIVNHMLKTIYIIPGLHKKMNAKNQKPNISKNTKKNP